MAVYPAVELASQVRTRKTRAEADPSEATHLASGETDPSAVLGLVWSLPNTCWSRTSVFCPRM